MSPNLPVEEEAKTQDGEPIPLSALQHAVYCLRQAALIHLEGMWAENRFTADGHILHVHTHKPGVRAVRGVRRVTSLPVASERLGISGITDMVEFHKVEGKEVPYPVEMKRGARKAHRADEVQLCAQALCLEEMTGGSILKGALFYAKTKRRVEVHFDQELRQLTEETIAQLAEVFRLRRTPPPTTQVSRCRACSLLELCRPFAITKIASSWRTRTLASLLTEENLPE